LLELYDADSNVIDSREFTSRDATSEFEFDAAL